MRSFAALSLCGCSLLFDPASVGPTAAPVRDLAVSDDLAVPSDLAMADLTAVDLFAPPDLEPPPDLARPDLFCAPPLFPGFFDGGAADPFDCRRCGCLLDDFTDAQKLPLRFSHVAAASGTWSQLVDGGTLTQQSAAVNNGDLDYFHSSGRFYLDGDFDLSVDFAADAWVAVSYAQLAVVGPLDSDAGAYQPIAVAQGYDSASGARVQLVAQDRSFDVPLPAARGTLEVSRTSGTLCAGVSGELPVCRSGAAPNRVYVQLVSTVSNAGCAAICTASVSCCTYRVRFSNFRLRTGTIRRTVQ